MVKLNQIVAVATGKKTQVINKITEIYQGLGKGERTEGMTKRYEPKDEEGEQLPGESKIIQTKVSDVLEIVTAEMADMLDVLLTQEVGNTTAMADVVVDGKKVLEQVPIAFLLVLEKQLIHVLNVVQALPVLDPAKKWTWSDEVGAYVTEEVKTSRTKKTPRVIVKYDATPEHPAQTELIYEDQIAGYWSTIHQSGAIRAVDKSAMIQRVQKLQAAAKIAREHANSIDIEQKKVNRTLLDFVFKG